MRASLSFAILLMTLNFAEAVDLKEAATLFGNMSTLGYRTCALKAREGTANIILAESTVDDARNALSSCVDQSYKMIAPILELNKTLVRGNPAAEAALKLAYTTWRVEIKSISINERPLEVQDTNFVHYIEDYQTEVDW